MPPNNLYEPYAYGHVQLIVRANATQGYGLWDRGIVREIHNAYPWDLITQYLPPTTRLVVDLGAHIGAFSLRAHHDFPSAIYLAVEPEPDNFALLQRNLAWNKTPIKAYCCHRWVGRLEDGETAFLQLAPGRSGSHRITRTPTPTPAPPPISLAELLHHTNTVPGDYALLKLDIEGGEWDFFRNTPPFLIAAFGVIVGEYHGPLDRFTTEIQYCEGLQNHVIMHHNYRAQWELGIFAAVKKTLLPPYEGGML